MTPNTTSGSGTLSQGNDQLRDKLISYIQDMYALEDELVQVLGQHADEAADFPVVQQHIQQHLEETKQHRQRMKDCLATYGKTPNGVKSALGNIMGKLQGAFSGAKADKLAMNSRDEYVAENFEIASYGMLIATAQAYGDSQTAQAGMTNLQDEVKTAKWLEAHTAEVALTSLVQDGISIPFDQIEQIQTQETQQMTQLWQSATQVAQQDTTPVFQNSSLAQSMGANNAPLYNAGSPPATTPATDTASGDTGTFLGSSSTRGAYGTSPDRDTTLSTGGTNRPGTVNANPDPSTMPVTDDDQIVNP
jgi:ferritin-like metal-binding protein YciE